MTEGRRLRRVPINMDMLFDIFTEGWEVGTNAYIRCYQGLPKGSKFISAGYDPLSGSEQLIFEHESFEPVKPGEIIPVLYIGHEIKSKDWAGIEVNGPSK